MNYEVFLVEGCPLCNIFKDPKQYIKTKLYYPTVEELEKNPDFVILDCETCKVPMVVIGEHTTSIGREQWGRVLYQCRRLFGKSMRLRLKRRSIKDHWHAHLDYWTEDLESLEDLR